MARLIGVVDGGVGRVQCQGSKLHPRPQAAKHAGRVVRSALRSGGRPSWPPPALPTPRVHPFSHPTDGVVKSALPCYRVSLAPGRPWSYGLPPTRGPIEGGADADPPQGREAESAAF